MLIHLNSPLHVRMDARQEVSSWHPKRFAKLRSTPVWNVNRAFAVARCSVIRQARRSNFLDEINMGYRVLRERYSNEEKRDYMYMWVRSIRSINYIIRIEVCIALSLPPNFIHLEI